MNNFKIHIIYKFNEGPWGGGNQFLKVLKSKFEEYGVYENDPEKADILLLNSYHIGNEFLIKKLFYIKKKYPEKIILHRIDGPTWLIRGNSRAIDILSKKITDIFADGIIYQSDWCAKQNRILYKIRSVNEIIIHNATNPKFFFRNTTKTFPKILSTNSKIRLIATSWSANFRKGFKAYDFLDKNLDFSKYEMTFVGNSPIKFKNIVHIKPVESEVLADLLRQHHIYITASQNDPCSNSLIEALSCGLPCIAFNDGGHPELIQNGGELFTDNCELIDKIKIVSSKYEYYQSKIPLFSIDKTVKQYLSFASLIFSNFKKRTYKPKTISIISYFKILKFLICLYTYKVQRRFNLLNDLF